MYRPIAKFAALFCALGLATPPVLTASSDEPASPAQVELEITGPRLINRGDTLHFHAFLTNRSAETIIVPAPDGMLQPVMNWKITDTVGKDLPVPHYGVGYCPVTSRPAVSDADFVSLKSGERMEIPVLGDPSDLVLFPGKGFYRISLT